jgi:uncharacterized membrane protein
VSVRTIGPTTATVVTTCVMLAVCVLWALAQR